MSTQFDNANPSMAFIGSQATVAPARPTWRQAFRRYRERLRRRRQLQDLVELDDHLLADIGISRSQASKAAREAGWIWLP